MSRVRQNINRDWRFFRGDIDRAERVDFDDSSWQPIGLPHCFDLPYFRTPELYVGVGWYRKRIHTEGLPFGKWLAGRLEFDGAFQVAEIFINGKPIGEHRGGYTGFAIDVGFQPGENLLAVRVSNEWNPRMAPRAGEHIFSGGLYRDVHLVVPIPLVAWNGIGITTPQVSSESAVLNVTTALCNPPFTSLRCTVRQTIVDPDGAIVATFESTKRLEANQRVEFDQTSAAIANPKLWHPDHPNLYTLRTEVFREEPNSEPIETKFGFRWFEWTADCGFFLNGEHLYLRGANAHQDHAGWGIGITRAACERDVKLIKDAGFNFVRGAHYPHHPAFADACDKHGLLFMSENCFWGKGGFGPEGYWNASAYPVNVEDFAPFEEHCKQTLREMIRINRNHPSIIAWSMCNEPFFTYNLDRAKDLLRDLVKLSHDLDPTRPAAIGGAQRGDIDRLGDIACYNGDGARLFINPGMPNMVSEYGAIHKPRDAFEPFYGELQLDRFPWRSGEAIWCAFDYGTIAGKQGLKGIVDHARIPKRSWHWYRGAIGRAPDETPGSHPRPSQRTDSTFSDSQECWNVVQTTTGAPNMLRLYADKTVITGADATDDSQLIVTICDGDGNHVANSPPVTLTIDSGPGELPTGRSITFDESTDIKLTLGRAAIAFRSYHGGETIIRATSPGLSDATIVITTIGSPAWESKDESAAVSRPYTPPKSSQASIEAARNAVNVALNRPSRASSSTAGHPAHFANDGNLDTFWSAEAVPAEWTADLEGFYELASLRLAFPNDGNFRFVVEVSRDDREWTTAIDRSATESTRADRNEVFSPSTIARYVRIRFIHAPAGQSASLRDVELFGILSLR